jgi:hypothetical protein
MNRIVQDYLKILVFPTAGSRLSELVEGTVSREELDASLGAPDVHARHYQDGIAGFGLHQAGDQGITFCELGG